MAKQIGEIKYSGKIGNMVHFKTKNGAFVRAMGNVDKERIANDPAFEGTRNGNSEFGYASRVGKLIRHGVTAITQDREHGDTNKRLLADIRKVMTLDTANSKGKRMLTEAIAGELKGFEWDPNDTVAGTLRTPFALSVDPEEGRVVMEVPKLVPNLGMRGLPGATHVELLLGVCVVDFAENSQMNRCDGSTKLDLQREEPLDVVMSCDIPAKRGQLVVIGLGIHTYKADGGRMYRLREGHGYKIVHTLVW